MQLALLLHLMLAAAWISCVVVEAIYEHTIDHSLPMRKFISQLHWNTDRFVEVPAFVGVLLTGGRMLLDRSLTPLLATKIVFGLLAIVLNAVCVWLVFKRLQYARKDDYDAWERVDHLQHKLGGIVAVALLVAAGIGAYLFAR